MRLRWRFENDVKTGLWYWATFDGDSNNIVEVSGARFNTLQACIWDAESRGCNTGSPTRPAGGGAAPAVS